MGVLLFKMPYLHGCCLLWQYSSQSPFTLTPRKNDYFSESHYSIRMMLCRNDCDSILFRKIHGTHLLFERLRKRSLLLEFLRHFRFKQKVSNGRRYPATQCSSLGSSASPHSFHFVTGDLDLRRYHCLLF